MIQAAASSLPSSLALGTGSQPAAGDDAANSGAFATALTASMTPRQDRPAAASGSANDAAAGQTPGKAAGNILPDPAGLAGSTAGTAGSTTTVAPTAAGEIVLPGLVIPMKAQPAEPTKPQADEAPTAENVAKTVAALLVRMPQPATAETAKPTKTAKSDAKESASAADDGATDAAPATAAIEALPLLIPVPISVDVQATATKASTATTQPGPSAPAATAAPASGKVQAPADAATTAATAPAAAAETAAQIVVNFALPQAAAEQAPVPLKPTVQQLAAHQSNAPQKAEGRTTATKPDTAPALATPLAAETAGQASHAAAHDDAVTAKTDVAADALPGTVSTEPQPLPVAVNAPSVSPAIAAPTTGAVPLSSHDFTALVDRLVAAREAASPQGVHAAISHSEFGQVSLRFDQDANGLTVSMSSADPEFARAVQASAASAGSQTAGDNGSAPRQGTQGHAQQQAAGSSSGQPQSQAQSQAYSREDHSPQTRRELRSTTRQNPETDRSDTSGDIFA